MYLRYKYMKILPIFKNPTKPPPHKIPHEFSTDSARANIKLGTNPGRRHDRDLGQLKNRAAPQISGKIGRKKRTLSPIFYHSLSGRSSFMARTCSLVLSLFFRTGTSISIPRRFKINHRITFCEKKYFLFLSGLRFQRNSMKL